MSTVNAPARALAAQPAPFDTAHEGPSSGVLTLLAELLESSAHGICVVDCADGYRVVYANRAARMWTSGGHLNRATAGRLAEVVADVGLFGNTVSLASWHLGQGAADAGRRWDLEVRLLAGSAPERRYVLVSSREQSNLEVLAEKAPAPKLDPRAAISHREFQVAELVALGLTNSEIARRLYLSRATVASHVAGILTKLRFRSRAQVAVWVVEQRQGLAAG